MNSIRFRWTTLVLSIVGGLLQAASCEAAIPSWVPGRDTLIAREIASWNTDNKSLFSVTISDSKFAKLKLTEGVTCDVMTFSGSIKNSSQSDIAGVIFDCVIVNRKTNLEVIRSRIAIRKTVYKATTVDLAELKEPFRVDSLYSRKPSVPLGELRATIERLGADASWYCQFVTVVPGGVDSDYGLDAYASLSVDNCLTDYSNLP
jgi:hypothetical protein